MTTGMPVGDGVVIDIHSRPPISEFLAYFDPERLAKMSARNGATGIPQAFVEGSMDGISSNL